MTGYSNYDIFMNYCEGYMDAYNDYDDFADRTYADTLKNLLGTSSNALNPHPLGSPEWRAQNRHLERLAGGVRTEHGDADAFAKDVDFFKDQDKIVKANEHAAENQHTLRAIKEALSNLAEQGIHLAKSNPLITAAIAAGCTTAGAITAFVVHKMRNKKKKGSNFSEYNDFFLRDNWEDYTISEGDPRKELRRNLARAIGNRTTKHPFDTRSQAIEAKLYHNGKRVANYLTPEEKKAIYDKSTKRSRSRYPTMNRREQRELD